MAYSDGEKAEAMIRLAINRYDFYTTSNQTGIPPQTLRRWNNNVPKKSIADLLDRAISRMLSVIPTDMTGNEWAIALGILLDKWLILQGEPTSRSENINHQLDNLEADEYERVIAEAETIIASAKSS